MSATLGRFWGVPLFVMVAVRVAGALFLPITDCDEIYNYWEPARYLLTGAGLQTWEYAPTFALRSWLFVWIYVWPAWLVRAVASSLWSLPALYFLIKACTAAVCAFAEAYLCQSASLRFGDRAGKVTFVCCLASAGIALSAPAFLPSSFAMVCYMFASGAWMRLDALPSVLAAQRRTASMVAVSAVAASAILGWPFAALLGLPIALDLLWQSFASFRAFFTLVSQALAAGAAMTAATVAVDAPNYCSVTFTPWNIVKYNVFGGADRGPELYGVEPWHFFFRNLTLNFGLLFWVALLGPALWWIGSGFKQSGPLKHTLPFLLWFVFWLRIPHKEERFMAPAYGFIALGAGLCLAGLIGAAAPKKGKKPAADKKAAGAGVAEDDCGCGHSHGGGGRHHRTPTSFRRLVAAMVLAASVAFGLSRASAMAVFYGAPHRSALALHNDIAARAPRKGTTMTVTVCLGREWHRYPSGFFIPEGAANLTFVKTKFTGALPKPFKPFEGSCGTSGAFNDLNMEEPDQAVAQADIATRCDYVVDSLVAGPASELPVSCVM